MPSSPLQIVFCITCKGRAFHIEQTLPRNLADNPDPSSRFVILNWNSPDHLLDYLVTNHKAELKSGKLVVYSHPSDQPFHVARAKNMAARCGIMEGADILVTLDADNFAGLGFARFVADTLTPTDTGTFLCPDFATITSSVSRPPRGYAGRLAIRSQDFIKMGGYDERFDTWRGEDMCMIARLRRIGYRPLPIPTRFLEAIRHGADVRFKEYPHAKKYENKYELQAIEASAVTVVNYGRIGCGLVNRNFDPAWIELAPVPTRVFGIGMHKTATTSLHKAFQILGFDSLHWGTGEAPKIWQEMNGDQGRSLTLEKFYAACDLPIPMLYEKLDRAYSRSKFILTVRDEDKWIKSVERLYDERYNPTRWEWEVYPFTNRIHTILYGRKDFDEQTFRARYRRHNREVMDYFRGRPGDLLVMDMDNGAGWPELCNFLGTPIPSASYPNEYVTRLL